MVDIYFTKGDSLAQLCPPSSNSTQGQIQKSQNTTLTPAKKEFKVPTEIKLCCGHVEANLSTRSIVELIAIIEAVKAGVLDPIHIDTGYGEYTNGTFSIMMQLESKSRKK